jgi:phosphatidate cytidylyltransferase
MAPVLSPKKTIVGAVGGVAGSTLVSWLLSLALSALYPQMHLQLEFILLGICGGLISMIGDLAASAIKRSHNIKDYGRLIPGHGGIMDRFDSIIFTAPVIYYLAVLLIGKV